AIKYICIGIKYELKQIDHLVNTIDYAFDQIDQTIDNIYYIYNYTSNKVKKIKNDLNKIILN
ncbi:MAG: hypothetical protein IJ997_04000, partial [Mycoplasmataceae bacterium]|nr:hypothetical protein [Mycoplasmataceae bacterium]